MVSGRSDANTGRIRLGMVGGGQGAFIGAVHRIAAQTGELSLSSRHPVGEGAMWVRVLRLDKPA